ncbi:uncharacterized protein LOC118521761 isoform X2 [Halichoerus grypus]
MGEKPTKDRRKGGTKILPCLAVCQILVFLNQLALGFLAVLGASTCGKMSGKERYQQIMITKVYCPPCSHGPHELHEDKTSSPLSLLWSGELKSPWHNIGVRKLNAVISLESHRSHLDILSHNHSSSSPDGLSSRCIFSYGKLNDGC